MTDETVSHTVQMDIRIVSLDDASVSPRWLFAWIRQFAEQRPAGKLMPILCLRVAEGAVQDFESRHVHAGDLRDDNRAKFLEYLTPLCERMYAKRHERDERQAKWLQLPDSWYVGQSPAAVATRYFFREAQGRRAYAVAEEVTR